MANIAAYYQYLFVGARESNKTLKHEFSQLPHMYQGLSFEQNINRLTTQCFWTPMANAIGVGVSLIALAASPLTFSTKPMSLALLSLGIYMINSVLCTMIALSSITLSVLTPISNSLTADSLLRTV